MAEALTTQEERAVLEFLAELRSREQNEVVPASQSTAVKFLMARKFDVPRAVDLFQAHRNTRMKEGIYDINPDEEPLRSELLSGKFTVLPQRDAKGAALALFTARLHRPDYTTHKAVLQAIIYQLDKAIESTQTQRDGLIFIYDMTNSSYGNFDYELCVKILNLLKGAFPARLKCVFIVSSPLWFRAPFAVLRLFVREKLRERVCTVKIHELSSHIPRESLPEHLGGSSHYSHIAWIQACVNSDRTGAAPIPSAGDKLNSNCADATDNAVLRNRHQPLVGRTRREEAEPGGPAQLPHPHVDKRNGSALTDGWGPYPDAGLAGRLGDQDKGSRGGSPLANQNGRCRQAPPRSNAPSHADCHKNGSGGIGGTPWGPRHNGGHGGSSPSTLSSLVAEQGGMTLKELLEHMKRKRRKGICREYEEIRKEPPAGTFDCSKRPFNQVKNRYSDVLCLDHSRVKLGPLVDDDHEEASDYINASFMDGYKQKNAYIAAQGPLPKTFADFWRMVWEQRVLIIVMTTRVVERGRVKCGQYWPLEVGTIDDHGGFLVRNMRVEPFQDFRLSHLELYDRKSGQRRSVAHYLYVSWPDFGVPKSAAAMLDFRAQVKQHQEAAFQAMCADWTGPAGGPPLVVHCSAGIGRTGTFCTLDICLSRLDDVGTVDVRDTVRRMRNQRAFSIQTWDQYYFCYTAVLEYGQRRGLLPPVQWSDSEQDTDSE